MVDKIMHLIKKIIDLLKKILNFKKYDIYVIKGLIIGIKKNITTIIIISLIAILFLILGICLLIEINVTISQVSVNYTELTLRPDENAELYATVLLSNNKQHNKVVWSSSNSDIVSVDESGKITAHKKGTAEITAQAKHFDKYDTAICTVNVKTEPTGYSIFLSAYTASTRDTVKIYVNTKPEDEVTNKIIYGIAPSGKPFHFQLSDKGYNFCSETGRWKVYAVIENSMGSYTGIQPNEIAYLDVYGEICSEDDNLQRIIEDSSSCIFSELFGQ